MLLHPYDAVNQSYVKDNPIYVVILTELRSYQHLLYAYFREYPADMGEALRDRHDQFVGLLRNTPSDDMDLHLKHLVEAFQADIDHFIKTHSGITPLDINFHPIPQVEGFLMVVIPE